ncbi:hypothetical protein phiIBB-PF7Ap07 [Pseudomonas phage phiIBB-PF7A]|uniref:Uncharacterized protein n=1 Tax=Pseudomonas phage phiIBB-PF7A TaxID=942165 RepID=E9KIE2_9CAUD|nr:hypothetical protein phiIBB-PF7Ap07 [Pseudomonas phage phiIBB-PF7A]ADV35667.1 hypothetical protein phiIBB-PF7Ap07 [Pseudomonas phage phiIBB-PF7A]
MHRNQMETQATQFADLVFTIVGTKVRHDVSCIVVNILKDRDTGQTGMKIVQTDWLIDKTSYTYR